MPLLNLMASCTAKNTQSDSFLVSRSEDMTDDRQETYVNLIIIYS